MRAKLEHLDTRLAELNSLLTLEESTKDMDVYRKLTREHSDIATVVEQFGLYRQAALLANRFTRALSLNRAGIGCSVFLKPKPKDAFIPRRVRWQ
jgi:hypothetical protein